MTQNDYDEEFENFWINSNYYKLYQGTALNGAFKEVAKSAWDACNNNLKSKAITGE